jgi:hypothetical protein
VTVAATPCWSIFGYISWILAFNTNLHSNGGTGFQPVQAQAEACGTKNHLMISDSVLRAILGA